MELIAIVREGSEAGVKQWLSEHPEPERADVVCLGVSALHWAASGENLNVRNTKITCTVLVK